MSRKVYSGWWRFRIKGRTRKYPWLYVKTEATSYREYRKKARFTAAMHLQRVEFDFEPTHIVPPNLKKISSHEGVDIFFDTTIGVKPTMEVCHPVV